MNKPNLSQRAKMSQTIDILKKFLSPDHLLTELQKDVKNKWSMEKPVLASLLQANLLRVGPPNDRDLAYGIAASAGQVIVSNYLTRAIDYDDVQSGIVLHELMVLVGMVRPKQPNQQAIHADDILRLCKKLELYCWPTGAYDCHFLALYMLEAQEYLQLPLPSFLLHDAVNCAYAYPAIRAIARHSLAVAIKSLPSALKCLRYWGGRHEDIVRYLAAICRERGINVLVDFAGVAEKSVLETLDMAVRNG